MIVPDLILVDEDNPGVLLMLEDLLEDEGFSVDTAACGEEAVAMLQASGPNYGALVTDLDLGGVLNGWDVARFARQVNLDIAVLYMTGAGDEGWPEMAMPKGQLLHKPFPLVGLSGLIRGATADQRFKL